MRRGSEMSFERPVLLKVPWIHNLTKRFKVLDPDELCIAQKPRPTFFKALKLSNAQSGRGYGMQVCGPNYSNLLPNESGILFMY